MSSLTKSKEDFNHTLPGKNEEIGEHFDARRLWSRTGKRFHNAYTRDIKELLDEALRMAIPEPNADECFQNDVLLGWLEERFRGRGAIISIAGPDGAGKTTLAEQLAEVFAKAGLPVQRIHCYAWYRNLFVMPLRLTTVRKEEQIIILDRCVFDNVIELARKMHMPTILLRGVLTTLSGLYTRFDAKILLWAPVASLISRRPEETMEKLEINQSLYAELVKTACYEPVESNGPILKEVLDLISRQDVMRRRSGADRRNE